MGCVYIFVFGDMRCVDFLLCMVFSGLIFVRVNVYDDYVGFIVCLCVFEGFG